MKNRQLLVIAKMFTLLFAPHYFPLLCMLVLLGFSYMNLFPTNYKIYLLVLVYLFTIAIPSLLTFLYQKITGLTRHQMSRREVRTLPYVFNILSYYMCCQIMTSMFVPDFAVSVIFAAMTILLLCAILNCWYKVSTHSAAAGAVNGVLIAFSLVFNFNPIWWLCATLIIAGCVGSSRLILRRHSLAEVNMGLLIGLVLGIVSILIWPSVKSLFL